MHARYPQTLDSRYFVVRGRLWRRSNPALEESERSRLVSELMAARRAVGVALRGEDGDGLKAARAQVDLATRGLGERGPVWWSDGAPDYNRHMVANTPYADWYSALNASFGTAEVDSPASKGRETEPRL